MSDPEVSSHFMEDLAFKETMCQALRKHSNDRDKNNLGILDFIKIPKFCGSYSPDIFSWIKQINILLGSLDIPDDIEGAFIMTFLDGAALDVLKMELPLGSFLPRKDTVYKILTQNFGYKHAILSTIMDEHRRLGQIPCHEMSLEDKTFKETCLQHLQLLHAVEEIFLDIQLLPEGYILTVKHVLPTDILRRISFVDMDNKERISLIKMNILQLTDVSRQCLIDRQVLRPERQNHMSPVRKFKEITCRICKIISSNDGKPLQPREHKISREGFIIKESCPELARLSKREKIGILMKNRICRSCLCLGIQTPLHPGKDCDYLKQKKLLFLECPANGCRIRSTLCDKHVCHPHKYSIDPMLCGPQARTQQCIAVAGDVNNRETVGVSFNDKESPKVHYDTESKSVTVNKPVGVMKNVRNIVKEKAKNIQEKSFEYEEMNSQNSDIVKERRSLSLCTNLLQALRALVFIFYYLVIGVKKIKRDFYKSEEILKRQSSETKGLKILDSKLDKCEFDPG